VAAGPSGTPFSWRPLGEADLPACRAIDPAAFENRLLPARESLAAWARLLSSRAFNGVVVETARPFERPRTVGFGASVFVCRAFAERELSSPQPGLNGRLLASLSTDHPAALTEHALRATNASSGLDLVVLASIWDASALSIEQAAHVRVLLGASFVELHAGYRLNRLLVEAKNQFDIDHARSAHVFRMVSSFAEYYEAHPDSGWNGDRALFTIDREGALAVTGSIAGIVFSYREPRLRLDRAAQELAAAALSGLTDEQLAIELAVSVSAVKKRWARLFDRVHMAHPDLLPWEEPGERLTRGPQKRSMLLAFLRRHPEELRPCRWPTAARTVRQSAVV